MSIDVPDRMHDECDMRRLPWDGAQIHSCMFRRSIAFDVVTSDTCGNEVLPRIPTAMRAGNDMIDGQR